MEYSNRGDSLDSHVSLPDMVKDMDIKREVLAMLYVASWEQGYDKDGRNNEKIELLLTLANRAGFIEKAIEVHKLGIERGSQSKTPMNYLEYEWDGGRINGMVE